MMATSGHCRVPHRSSTRLRGSLYLQVQYPCTAPLASFVPLSVPAGGSSARTCPIGCTSLHVSLSPSLKGSFRGVPALGCVLPVHGRGIMHGTQALSHASPGLQLWREHHQGVQHPAVAASGCSVRSGGWGLPWVMGIWSLGRLWGVVELWAGIRDSAQVLSPPRWHGSRVRDDGIALESSCAALVG